jgi:hypothetical protein
MIFEFLPKNVQVPIFNIFIIYLFYLLLGDLLLYLEAFYFVYGSYVEDLLEI